MHFLCSSSVCVLPRYSRAHIELLYIDINGIASYCITYKYIDMSNKLNIPPHPNIAYKEICHSTSSNTFLLINTFIP